MSKRTPCEFDTFKDEKLRKNLRAYQVVDVAVDDCLRTNPFVEPGMAAAYLALVLSAVQQEKPNRIYATTEDSSIQQQTIDAFECRRFKHPFEQYEQPDIFHQRNGRIAVYQEATILLLNNVAFSGLSNPIVQALDS